MTDSLLHVPTVLLVFYMWMITTFFHSIVFSLAAFQVAFLAHAFSHTVCSLVFGAHLVLCMGGLYLSCPK